jgi:hypothetical protein
MAFGLSSTCRSIALCGRVSDGAGWRGSWLATAKNLDLARLARSASIAHIKFHSNGSTYFPIAAADRSGM